MVERNRAAIECGEVRVEFLARKAIARVPVVQVNTPRGVLRVSSPEATAIDLVGTMSTAGGVDTVATVLAELAERLDAEKLAAAARTAPIALGSAARVPARPGRCADKTEGLGEMGAHGHATEYAQLIPGRRRAGERSKKWRLVVNAKVEIET